MSTENTKSPLKETGKATYTGLGTGMQNKLIEGAYLSARAGSPDYSWMNVIGGGIKAFKEEVDTARANKEAEREETLAGIQTTVDGIYEAGGSMPKAYFDQAYDYTEQLRERYIAAVESGDVKAQHQIKGELNGFATTIQSTKDSLVEGAESWKDKALIDESGMTDYQLAVNASFKEENAQLVDGSYKWKNVNYDPNNPNSKEFFTLDDYKEALPLRDDANKEVYLKDGQNVLDAREKWLNGEGEDFDVNTQRKKNIKIVDDSIKSVGSIQSMLYDDITGQGSFANTFNEDNSQHPDYASFFENIMTKDGLENVKMIGLHDKSGDGVVGYEDFIDMSAIPGSSEFETDGKPGISNEELMAAIEKDKENNGTLEEDIKDLIRPKIKDALLNVDNPNYNEDLTKSMLVDFMTNRQSQMFYGQHDGKADNRYKELIPTGEDDARVVFTPATKDEKGKLVIDGQEIESLEAYKTIGGSYRYLKERGYYWDPNDGGWLLNKGAQFYNENPMATTSTSNNGALSR